MDMTDVRLHSAGAWVLVTASLLAAAGCTTLGATSADARQLREVLRQWKVTYETQDLQGMMRLYADDYSHKGKDKAGIEKAVAEYWRDDDHYEVKVNIDDATVSIQDDRAVVVPIALAGTAGSDSAKLELTKEEGHWRITGTEF
jgi:ketosteroid isomerase-like protein